MASFHTRLSGTKICAVVALLSGLLLSTHAAAQTSPVDLSDMGLAELLEMDVEWRNDTTQGRDAPRFHLGYRYARARFEGYRDGTTDIPLPSLLGPPTPTGATYPVLPTVIVQQAHILDASYDITPHISVSVMFPVQITQSTDHISVVPGYSFFNIESDGVGDLAIGGTYRFAIAKRSSLSLSAGVSFPTGSIEEKGDTPRPTPDPVEQLPYTMQLGSGTYDFPMSISFRSQCGEQGSWSMLSYGVGVLGKLRTGRNDRNYRLGNRVHVGGWVRVRPLSWIEPFLRLSFLYWGQIEGQDDELLLAPGVYPAPVTNPDFFGGTKLHVTPGVAFYWPRGLMDNRADKVLSDIALEFEFGVPVYQNLNGPQPQEDYRLSAGLKYEF